jgi:cytochrome c-type biogenesis protein CcmH/NrfG
VLMKQSRFADAEQVYRDDLARLPANGWSLLGLAESLRAQKKNSEEIAKTKEKFEKVWAKADLKINSSCLCQPRT